MSDLGGSNQDRRIAVFYEHPARFEPPSAELERRGVAYDRLLAYEHCFDPAQHWNPYALLVNRMSPSADTPPPHVVEAVKRITAAAHIEVGGVEYLVNSRDGNPYFSDINALSNFVADAPTGVGFDPFLSLVDYILARAGLTL